MEKSTLIILIICITIGLSLLAWAPWINEGNVYDLVMDHLEGSNTMYSYLGDMMPVKDIPKNIVKLPFICLVYFSGEAMYIVLFFGIVIRFF